MPPLEIESDPVFPAWLLLFVGMSDVGAKLLRPFRVGSFPVIVGKVEKGCGVQSDRAPVDGLEKLASESLRPGLTTGSVRV